MDMMNNTESKGKIHFGSFSRNSKIGLNGARRDLEALIKINFFSLFFALTFLIFFSQSASQE